jgi:recombination protein RecA
MDIRRTSQIKSAEEVLGNRVRVKVVKNKIAPPFREAEFDIMYNQGISREGDVLDLAIAKGIMTKAGAWIAYGGENIAQGREAGKQYLKDNPKVLEKVAKEVKDAYKAA